MATTVEQKYIALKHIRKGIYPASSFVAAGALAHLPLSLLVCFVYCPILYFMAGLTPLPSNFFFFVFMVFLTDVCFRNLMALFSYLGKTLQAAQAFPLPILALLILYAGFLVSPNSMGGLKFLWYIDLFAWVLRALAQEEFLSARYDIPFSVGVVNTSSFYNGTLGQFFLYQSGQQTDGDWRWYGVAFVVCIACVIIMLSFLIFRNLTYDRNVGSNRDAGVDGLVGSAAIVTVAGGDVGEGGEEEGGPAAVKSSKTASLPFTPMCVVFRDVTYTVTLPKRVGGGTRRLLAGLSGYALPGRILALMGASGSGKTTLLDVLAGRKNSGVMTGTILLNGFPKDEATFNRVAAYVEQSDIHSPLTTVREALEFSAILRLPPSVTAAEKAAFCDEVLELLELTPIQGRLVGSPGAPNGLSPGERKRLTIGVELMSNSPLLFLDEPTSGLDARAASVVMRVVRNVANTGRCVICTIHQPSADLFLLFDDLLLLQRGGFEVYLGPLGRGGKSLTDYLSAVPGIGPYPLGMNPSSWMLEVLQSAGAAETAPGLARNATMASVFAAAAKEHAKHVAHEQKLKELAAAAPTAAETASAAASSHALSTLTGPALHLALMESHTWEKATAVMDKYAAPKPGDVAVSFGSHRARGFGVQLWALLTRLSRSYSRNVGLNVGRTMALLFLGLLFGIVWFNAANNSVLTPNPKNPTQEVYITTQPKLQTLVASIFMTAAFSALINRNTAVPPALAQRPVFYREVLSYYFDPLAFSLSNAFVELPWLAVIVLAATPIPYFMIQLSPSPSVFFFHYFVTLVLAFVYVSIGSFLAGLMPTFETAQLALGLLSPLFFL